MTEREFLQSLGVLPSDPVPSDDSRASDFDGGARQPAPLDSDPILDHDEWVLDFVRQQNQGWGFGP